MCSRPRRHFVARRQRTHAGDARGTAQRLVRGAGAFDTLDYTNSLGLAARAHTPAHLDAAMAPLGWTRRRWFGVRVFTDHRDEPVPGPDDLGALLATERIAGARDPYRQVAALLHLICRR